ncbi:TPA: hypothetical protein VDU52_001425 [Pseudomonas aeruginosa]|nr:hypothetical protein [Pseudomonas aeruginosa]
MSNNAKQNQCELILSRFALDVLAELYRQIQVERHNPVDNAAHQAGELALAATCYADEAITQICCPARDPYLTHLVPGWWPLEHSWWKPSLDARKNLVKAAALLIAQGDVIDQQSNADLGG